MGEEVQSTASRIEELFDNTGNKHETTEADRMDDFRLVTSFLHLEERQPKKFSLLASQWQEDSEIAFANLKSYSKEWYRNLLCLPEHKCYEMLERLRNFDQQCVEQRVRKFKSGQLVATRQPLPCQPVEDIVKPVLKAERRRQLEELKQLLAKEEEKLRASQAEVARVRDELAPALVRVIEGTMTVNPG